MSNFTYVDRRHRFLAFLLDAFLLLPPDPALLMECELLETWCRYLLSLAAEESLVQGCQMAKFDPFLSLDCARVEGMGAQSKERKGSNFAA